MGNMQQLSNRKHLSVLLWLPSHIPLPETAWKNHTPKPVTNTANFLVVSSRNTGYIQLIAAWLSIKKKNCPAFAFHGKVNKHLTSLTRFSAPRRMTLKKKKDTEAFPPPPSIQLLITHPSLMRTFGTNSCSEQGKYFQGSNLQILLGNSVRH